MTCSGCGASNPKGMRFCGMCGAPLQPQVSGRERRRVSVAFIDLASFSRLTHGFDPEELRDLADEVLTVVAGVVEDYDGYVDAFRGDGLIALFGAPHSHPDDPQRAVLAAAAGLRAIENVGESRGHPLSGRAGVNTGIVIAGSVGLGRTKDYTVMGSTVNLAARLEAAAKPGEVWVGPETYEATRFHLLYEPTPQVTLAGFPDITQVHRLTSIDGQERHQADPYAHLEFVGRQRERTALRAVHDQVMDSCRPQETWLVGEAGSGKTRLLRDFLGDIEALGGQILWIESRPGEGFSWWPLARQLFELHEGEDNRLQQQRIRRTLERLLPNEPRWRSLVLASLELESRKPWTRLERRSVDRTILAWRDLLVAYSLHASLPTCTVLVVENNPRDGSLLEFLALIQETEAPIMTVRTNRNRELPSSPDSDERNRRIISLDPLSLEDSQALLNQLASPVLKVATEALVYQVGGVPAYLLELGRALSITQGGSFSGSLTSLLQARLDMLPPATRQLLSYSALAGERCWEGLLHELSDNRQGVDFQVLTDENLLVQEARTSIPNEVEYRFQSELLRHAVLRMIPFGVRPILHLRIANWLEQHAPLAHAELTGNHFEQGGSPDAAFAHYLASAEQAATLLDDDNARRLYERLLSLEVTPDLLAQGALSYVRAAIEMEDMALAERQLGAAAKWIQRCAKEARQELEQVLTELGRQVEVADA